MTFGLSIIVIIETINTGSFDQVINAYYFSILADTFFLLSAAVAIIVIRMISKIESAAYENQI